MPHPRNPHVKLREARVVELYHWCEVYLLVHMALQVYFSPMESELPTATKTGIGKVVMTQANQTV